MAVGWACRASSKSYGCCREWERTETGMCPRSLMAHLRLETHIHNNTSMDGCVTSGDVSTV